VEIKENKPPVIVSPATDPSCIVAHYALDYSVPKSSYSEPEGEAISYSFTYNDSAKASWIVTSETATHLHFGGTPNNLQRGDIILTINVDDPHSGTATTEDNVTICVLENRIPYLSGSPTSPPTGIVGLYWEYLFDVSWVSDYDSESLTHECGISPDNGWVTCDANSTHVHFRGTPSSNTQALEYELSVINKDPHSDVADFTWNGNFTMAPNVPPTIASVTDQTLKAPDDHLWNYGASITSDPESLPISKTIRVNNSLSIPPWLTYDLSDYTFSIIGSRNYFAGVHTVTLGINDGFNPEVTTSFILTVEENLAPFKIRSISNYEIVNFNPLHVQFDDIYSLFEDPDGRNMTPKVKQYNGADPPTFLTYDEGSNQIFGTPQLIDVGTWNLEYIAKDDHNLTGVISFKVIVNRKSIY